MCSIFTFIHEERLASENFFSHDDASWAEMRIFQTVLSAQLSQQLRWLQTVSPGVITFTNRQTDRKRQSSHKYTNYKVFIKALESLCSGENDTK